MSEPTIGWRDAARFVMLLSASCVNVGAHVVEVRCDPLQLGEQDVGKGNLALLAIEDKTQLENIGLAKGVKEMGEAAEQLLGAEGKNAELSEPAKEGAAMNAFEANVPGEIRRWDGPDPPLPDASSKTDLSYIGGPLVELQIQLGEAGQRLADKIRQGGELAIANFDEHSDRSANDVRQQAEDGAEKIESMAAHMQTTNEAFQERIKNEPIEKQNELMKARVDEQEKILIEKFEVAITELSRPEPAREAPSRD